MVKCLGGGLLKGGPFEGLWYKRKIAAEMYNIVKGKEGHRLEGMYTTIHTRRKGEKIERKRLKSVSE